MWVKLTLPTINKTNRKGNYLYTNYLMEQRGITSKEKQRILFQRYNKWSRKQLTDDELEDFISFLEKYEKNSRGNQ